MSTALPARLPSRSTDRVLPALGQFFLPQIHLVVDLAGPLDGDRLALALRRSLDAEPVLGCRFVPRWLHPFWTRIDAEELDRVALLRERQATGVARERATVRFVGEPLDAADGPLLRALLLRGGGGDRLVLKVHHGVADAGATKQVAQTVCGLYRRLGAEPDHRPAPSSGSRSLRQLWRRVLPGALLPMTVQYLRDAVTMFRPLRSVAWPLGDGVADGIRVALRHVDPASLDRARARVPGATINDVLVGAMVRATWVRAREACGGGDPSGRPRVLSTIDLRRHLPDRRADGICNLSSFVFPRFEGPLEGAPGAALQTAKRAFDRVKAGYGGLGFLFYSLLLTGCVPFALDRAVAVRALAAGIRAGNLPPVLTNMGPIPETAVDLGETAATGAFLVAPPTTVAGALCVGASGFRGRITLSAGTIPPGNGGAELGGALAAIAAALGDDDPATDQSGAASPPAAMP